MTRKLNCRRSMFLHIPRTGGTWVSNVLRECHLVKPWKSLAAHRLPVNHTFLSHYPPQQLANIEYIFAFVRHPVRYYESVWKWITKWQPNTLRVATRWRWHPHKSAVQLHALEFNTWVERMVAQHPSWVTRLYEGYVGPQGGEFVHFIGRTYSLKADLFAVFKRLGLESVWEYNKFKIDALEMAGATDDIEVGWDPDLKAEVLRQECVVLNRFFSENSLTVRDYRRVRKKLCLRKVETNGSN